MMVTKGLSSDAGERLIGRAVELHFAQLLLKNNVDETALVSSRYLLPPANRCTCKNRNRTFSSCPPALLFANRTCGGCGGVYGMSLIPIIPDPSMSCSTINEEGRPHRGGPPKGISNLSALAPRWRFEEKPVGGLRPIRQR